MRRLVHAALAATFVVAGCNNDSTGVVDGPAPPRALEGSYYAEAITLTWELGSGWDGESFRVYGRRVSDADYFLIADVTSCTGGICTYTDTNIQEDVTYEYYVAAWDPATGAETASDFTVEVRAPFRTPPPVPDQTEVIGLDGAAWIVWGDASRHGTEDDFSFYRVYQAAPDGNDYLLGETDSEGFIDLLAANGSTYEYFVTSVDVDGHESAGSQIVAGTPRPDYTAELLYDYFDVPEESGFRFQESDASTRGDRVFHGDDPGAHFSVERDQDGFWWLVPTEAMNTTTTVNPNGVFTSELKCGVAADPDCLDATLAPSDGYTSDAIPVDPEHTYFLRVYDDQDDLHYGAIRVTMQGENQNGGVMIFDWAYQLQPGNPELAPGPH
ncbi:MAG: hypothetical protein U5R14_10375 [Gemmatimonadota bacterium]|nr:hypothetical protein [Gemmatimonadota bacterium]